MNTMIQKMKNRAAVLSLTLAISALNAVPALAQLPTGVPSVIQDAIDDFYLFLGSSGVLILSALAVVTLYKWARAAFA